MTNIDTLPEGTTVAGRFAERRTLVVLASIYLVSFVVMMATSTDRKPDADPAKILATYDTTLAQARVQTFALMALCGLLVFLGAAIRSALVRGGRSWTADVVLAGFALLAMTYAGFGVTTMVLYHAVDIGNPTLVSAANLLDTTNFLPAMPALMSILIGTGVTTLKNRALPTWLSWVSIVLGVMAPLGPGGFAPFMLLPVWAVVVAATLHRSTETRG